MSDTDTHTEFVQQIAGVTERWEWHTDEQHEARVDTTKKNRQAYYEALNILGDILVAHPLFPAPNISLWTNGSSEDRPIYIHCYSAAEMRAVVAALGSGEKFVDDHGDQALRLRWEDTHFVAKRGDQQCNMVPEVDEDGNEVTEEVTVREVIAPEKVREVVKTVPKMRRECPPILAD